MQKIKLKDYLQAMYHQHKIFNLEVLEGDMVYVGKEIKPSNQFKNLCMFSFKYTQNFLMYFISVTPSLQ